MMVRSVCALVCLLCGPLTKAEPPQLYRRAEYESPVRGGPDDLLMLAGFGFRTDDRVVYHALEATADEPVSPNQIPPESSAELGVAPIVSAADAPYSLTVRLPAVLRSDQTYALWVVNVRGEWSRPVKINDARPLWITPAFVYESKMPGSLPRELKVVGRNLQPSANHTTRVQLVGPEHFAGEAFPDSGSPGPVGENVARFSLPRHLKPGRYRVQLSRDGTNWVEVAHQFLEVLGDPGPIRNFSVADPEFGGCRPDDGADDTACIVHAIAAAARVGGGTVTFGRGTWNLARADTTTSSDGIIVPQGVSLQGAGSGLTTLNRYQGWSTNAAVPVFSLAGRTNVTGFTFHDMQRYQPDDRAGPFLQLGQRWSNVLNPERPPTDTTIRDVVISHNIFDQPLVGIASGGLPIERLIVSFNTFGAYRAALYLTGDKYNVNQAFRIDDSVIAFNTFKPGSELDLVHKTGTMASELGAGMRVDFSHNQADGSSADYLYQSDDAKGWRAGFFWDLNNNVEKVLISQNTATCTGDKIGDGEAIAFDNNNNTFPLKTVVTTINSAAAEVTAKGLLSGRQHGREVPVERYYAEHWIHIVDGPGIGQVRKIKGYETDEMTGLTRFHVTPSWDVRPTAGKTRFTVAREFWQVYAIGNVIDNRQPLCQKSNRSRRGAGQIVMWAQNADSIIANNEQYDSDGILVQQSYNPPEHSCPDCTMEGFFVSFLAIHDNLIEGKYDWDSACSSSGITAGIAAAPWDAAPPPTVGFGLSIAHNIVKHADSLRGGGIAQLDTWLTGPEPHRWPLGDNLLIHHNSISNISGPIAAKCGPSRPRMGIAFPDAAIAWRTVLYSNTCTNVSTPIGSGGVGTVKVCPSSVPDSCECTSQPVQNAAAP